MDKNMDKVEQKKTICPLDCPDSCGMIATIVNGRITGLSGDKDHPYTNGFICRKMRSYPERVYDPKRILFPQIRDGRKGEGNFRRISWDETFDILVNRLTEIKQKYGGESILPYSYAGNMGAVNRFAGYPFFHRLGTSRLDQTICAAASGAGWQKHCGSIPGSPPEKALDADLIVCWGMNCKVTNVHFWQYVAKAKKRGCRVLVIDPYRNATAKSADIYQVVKPGGDVSLALGILKALIERHLVSEEYINKETAGFDQLSDYLKNTDWQEFVTQSGVEKERMEELSGLFSHSPRTFLRLGTGLTRNSRGGMAVRAITSLAAALGLFGAGNGKGILDFTGGFRGDNDKLTYPSLAEKTTRKVNMIQLGHALTVLEPPVKGLIVYNSNPLSVNPDGATVRRGMMREDLFTVVHEHVMTPTARYADLLLPATTFLENRDIYTSYGHFYMGVVEPAVPPIGEGMSNFDLFQSLAAKMGFEDAPFKQSCDERIADYLGDMEGIPSNVSIPEVMEGGYVLSTRANKTGSLLADHHCKFQFSSGFSPKEPGIPCLIAGGEFDDVDLQSRFPFMLITPPHMDLLNSTFGERYPEKPGELLIHPQDAAASNIHDGEAVILENYRGWTTRFAKVTEDTQRGLLVAEGVFWQSGGLEGNAINDLTSQNLSDMGGGATYHESRVRLKRVQKSPSPDIRKSTAI
jgi:anaerobic selenocysteine-containing dehydrogenase